MMKRKYFFLNLVFLLSAVLSFSQDRSGIHLEKYFARLRENLPSSQKIIICDSIRNIIGPYAASDSVFTTRFESLRYLGQITSSDSLLKILNWNMVSEDGNNFYFCYLIHRKEKGMASKVYYLNRAYREVPPEENRVYNAENWYGALYYDIRPFIFEGEKCYALLGIDYGNPFITRKIIETLRITPDGNLHFGVNCLTNGKQIRRRAVFEYGATAVMSLKFEADTLIVFDHLSPFSPEFLNNRQYYGPDFSFDAYVLRKDGMWMLKEDIEIKNRKK